MAGIVRLLKSRPEPFPGDGRTGGTVEAGLRTGGRSESGGPEPEAYLKRSDREEPASAGGEISRAAMVSRDCGRPRSCARGAGNGAGHGSGNDDNAAGSSLAMDWSWTARTHHRAIGSIVQGTHGDAAAIAGCAADNDGPGFPVRYERR